MPVLFDRTHRPVEIIRFVGDVSDDEYRDYLSEIDGIIASARRMAIIVDARNSKVTSMAQRRMQAMWMKTNLALHRERVACMVFLIDSPAIRGVLTAILWLQPLVMPHRVLKKLEDGVAWCHEQLAASADLRA